MPFGVKGFQKNHKINNGRSSWNKGKTSWAKGKKFSQIHKQKIAETKKGEKNYRWTSNPNYHALHEWLVRNYGRACRCENYKCVTEKPKRYEWSLLKDKKHERKRENYWMLCVNCHHKYDNLVSNFKKSKKKDNVL